ncbi:MAG: aminotransferase class I/II-fold pyridoxal phosphate-dependent enzyme, partial [Pseudomonadota bacterium]
FKPDLDRCKPSDLERAAAFVACSPNNPTASVLEPSEIEALIRMARQYDFIAVFDEAYSEIYFDHPPAGALEVAQRTFGTFSNVVASNSLSKRSGVPGLRGGFVAGDPDFVGTDLYLARAYTGPQIPLPLQEAQAALWADETHVEIYRARYLEARAVADSCFNRLDGYRSPDASFFVWLPVGDGSEVARNLWQDAAIKVLPGEIMSRRQPDGSIPGKPFIRLPLVYGPEVLHRAFSDVAALLARDEKLSAVETGVC